MAMRNAVQLYDRKEYAEAIKEFEVVLRRSEPGGSLGASQLYDVVADCYAHVGQHDLARHYRKKARSLQPVARKK